jgi:hypothetical protein
MIAWPDGSAQAGPRVEPDAMPSTVIRRWSYDEARHRLDIEFVSGRQYAYLEVPERIAEGMRRAVSKGGYFNRRIRDRFRFERVRRG